MLLFAHAGITLQVKNNKDPEKIWDFDYNGRVRILMLATDYDTPKRIWIRIFGGVIS